MQYARAGVFPFYDINLFSFKNLLGFLKFFACLSVTQKRSICYCLRFASRFEHQWCMQYEVGPGRASIIASLAEQLPRPTHHSLLHIAPAPAASSQLNADIDAGVPPRTTYIVLDSILKLVCVFACTRLALLATYCDLRQCSVILFKSFKHWKALRLTFTHVFSLGLFTSWKVGHTEGSSTQ